MRPLKPQSLLIFFQRVWWALMSSLCATWDALCPSSRKITEILRTSRVHHWWGRILSMRIFLPLTLPASQGVPQPSALEEGTLEWDDRVELSMLHASCISRVIAATQHHLRYTCKDLRHEEPLSSRPTDYGRSSIWNDIIPPQQRQSPS